MTYRTIRPLCYTVVIMLTAVLALTIASWAAAKKPDRPQWEWQVEIHNNQDFQLDSDGNGAYTNTGNVEMRVNRVSQGPYSFYSFGLLIQNDMAGRRIRFPNVTLTDVGMNLSKVPGFFPISTCGYPLPPPCDDKSGCGDRVEDFLDQYHPECGYAVFLRIEVSLDIESMTAGEEVALDSDDLIVLTIYGAKADAGDPPVDQIHNLQAQNAQKDGSRYSPLWIMRTGPDSWKMGVSSPLNYMNYYEYYYTSLGRGREKHLVPEIPLAAYGPFNFEMTWTRLNAGK